MVMGFPGTMTIIKRLHVQTDMDLTAFSAWKSFAYPLRIMQDIRQVMPVTADLLLFQQFRQSGWLTSPRNLRP